MTIVNMQDAHLYPGYYPWDMIFSSLDKIPQGSWNDKLNQANSSSNGRANSTSLQVNQYNTTWQSRDDAHNKLKPLLDRKTPEIYEPRKTAYECDSMLRKKVVPFKSNTPELPSIDTFCKKNFDPYEKKQLKRKSKIPASKAKVKKKLQSQPSCGCNINENEKSGPFYTHLGSARTLEELKTTLKNQLAIKDEALKVHLVKYTGVEGKNGDGCPLARWVLRRTGPEEKYLVVAKRNVGHICNGAFTVIALVAWDGISKQYADDMYQYLRKYLNVSGYTTRRRCGTNESKTCMCQGENEETKGASFSFGCSWSIFFNGCKFAKSVKARKFKMQEPEKEDKIEKVLEDLATNVSPLLNVWAPKAFDNMTRFEKTASDCRIGKNVGRPFSGVTCCMDFCAHSHRDIHNMLNGTTMVCTLLKPDYVERDDEQLHVLPLYQLINDFGDPAPANFQIPNHFMHSKLKERQEPTEGKGKYVHPYAVNSRKMEQTADEKKLMFQDENEVSGMFVGCNDREFTEQKPIIFDGSPINLRPHFVDGRDTCFRQVNNVDVKTPLSDMPTKLHSKPTYITSDMGGVAIALGHGSFLVECARKELHATTALRNPQRNKPTRISMVFYQHKKLNKSKHGFYEHQEKMRVREAERKLERESFDDLALLADTAFMSSDSNMTSEPPSLENTPEKRNPLLELCRQDARDRAYSSSEPNIPTLFKTEPASTDIGYSHLHSTNSSHVSEDHRVTTSRNPVPFPVMNDHMAMTSQNPVLFPAQKGHVIATSRNSVSYPVINNHMTMTSQNPVSFPAKKDHVITTSQHPVSYPAKKEVQKPTRISKFNVESILNPKIEQEPPACRLNPLNERRPSDLAAPGKSENHVTTPSLPTFSIFSKKYRDTDVVVHSNRTNVITSTVRLKESITENSTYFTTHAQSPQKSSTNVSCTRTNQETHVSVAVNGGSHGKTAGLLKTGLQHPRKLLLEASVKLQSDRGGAIPDKRSDRGCAIPNKKSDRVAVPDKKVDGGGAMHNKNAVTSRLGHITIPDTHFPHNIDPDSQTPVFAWIPHVEENNQSKWSSGRGNSNHVPPVSLNNVQGHYEYKKNPDIWRQETHNPTHFTDYHDVQGVPATPREHHLFQPYCYQEPPRNAFEQQVRQPTLLDQHAMMWRQHMTDSVRLDATPSTSSSPRAEMSFNWSYR